MAERLDALEKKLSQAQEWIAFSETDIWRKLKERIEKEIIFPAKEAFWATDIEGVDNEKLIRHTLSQRAVVRTAEKIIGLVERHKIEKDMAQAEIEKIEKAKQRAGEKPITLK